MTATRLVLDEVADERRRQVDDHGWDDDHDDRHDHHAWGWLILRRVTELVTPASVAVMERSLVRRMLVEVAAIAVAAIEALDRREEAT